MARDKHPGDFHEHATVRARRRRAIMRRSFTRNWGGGLLVFSGLLASCASQQSTKRTETSAATVRAAQELGADRVPAADLHLQLAQEQMEYARRLQEEGGDVNYADSQLLLM